MIRFLCFVIALAMIGLGQTAAAAEKIVAVVNDSAITQSDIRGRVTLSIANTGMPNTPEVREKLAPQTLRTLIDETLQLQEADRLHITVNDEEIDKAIAQMAQQNKIAPEDMGAFLADKGVPLSAMKNQIRATIAWSKVAQRRLRPAISVGESEIDAELERIKTNTGKKEYLLSEIFLAVDDTRQEEDIKRLAERLIQQLGQGANFSSMARQFSQSATAATGGDMGWVQEGQLSTELDKVLQAGQPGTLSPPIRDASGYYILGIREARTVMGPDPQATTMTLQQLFFPFSMMKDKKNPKLALKEKVESILPTLKGCDAIVEAGKKYPHPINGELKNVKLGSVPPPMARVLTSLEIGQPSMPLVNAEGALIMMVCDKTAPEVTPPSRDQVLYNLMAKRMTLMQQRFLRDLRQTAFIKINV